MNLPPILIFLASNIVLTLTAAHTSHKSPLRYISLIFLIFCASIFPSTLFSYCSSTGILARLTSGAVFWNIISCFDRLILRKWDYYHYGPVTQTSTDEDKLDGKKEHYPGTRMQFASEATGNSRGIGLFWQVRNVACFDEMRPGFIPSRPVFLVVQAFSMVTCYFVYAASVKMIAGLNSAYLKPGNVPFFTRLSEVSADEVKVRILSTVGLWASSYCILQGLAAAFASIAVISDADAIKLWRPQFGSFNSLYTIRNFWGKFWHQNLRLGLEGVSEWFAHDVLHLPKQGLLQRYTKVLCIFVTSGCMHIVSDMGAGLEREESGALTFFMMQAAGIILEDGVQAIYKRWAQRNPGLAPGSVPHVVGYVWLVAFLIWTTPAWGFPVQRRVSLEDESFNLRAIKPLFFGRSA